MQALHVWFPGPPSRPGCAHAKLPSRPGSRDTRESSVSLEPGSAAANALRMGDRADTQNRFCARGAGNQTASELDLYSCVHEPIKQLWHLASLAAAGLYAACEPGCGHPQTNRAYSYTCKHSNSHIATTEHSSSSSFTNLMNSSIPSSDPENTNTQQHGFQPHQPMIFPPHQYDPRSFPPPFYPQNFNPFGVQPGYHQFPSSNYHHCIPFQVHHLCLQLVLQDVRTQLLQ